MWLSEHEKMGEVCERVCVIWCCVISSVHQQVKRTRSGIKVVHGHVGLYEWGSDKRCVRTSVHMFTTETIGMRQRTRPNRMRHGARILAKLSGTKCTNIFNPLDGFGIQVTREFLVAKDGQT